MADIIHGKSTALSTLVHRITAPNPGVMTGPGTNSYLVGTKELALIDPGPHIASHVDAILAAIDQLGGTLRWILCTHTHLDHSPAAGPLREATGATVMGMKASIEQGQDSQFQPDQPCGHDQQIDSTEFTLRAIHTPGHASNHLCFYLEEEDWLFTGDHIMQGSTVVIVPPDGDMKAYLESLESLKRLPLSRLAPAHGHLIDTPRTAIDSLIQHRLGRETKVLQALQNQPSGTLEQLTERVYDDVDPGLHGIAKYSLLAHLEKLEQENRAVRQGQRWRSR